jgi:serine/threonine protein kinase
MALAKEPAEVTTRLTIPGEQSLGTMIGRYKLLEKIGEGGFGVVYVAEQREPVKRRVALKIIKLGMDTKQVIARFEAERQALALMDHPNIAKVFDAGATDAGRPYFVMELVRGIKMTDYCEQNNVSTRQRLDLFISVCQAIQHAHQKGIIHRDIKPSNILVTLHDGVPVPKVIDFGIAKATQGELTDKTVYTQLQEFIGTPAYMSPEQAEMSGLDIDTRADIYSLGVLLYELLTCKTPFDAEDLLKAGLEQMRRTIREKEPLKPSTRLTNELTSKAKTRKQEAEMDEASSRRLLQLRKLIELLRGDLDWIVMKCLEKDRTRRYETANGLASDVQRYLNTEPVTARPPSQIYRVQKLVRRNRLAFGAGAAVFAALVIGLGLSTWLFVKERGTRQLAQAEGKKARSEAAKSQQVAKFLQDMLQSVGPSVAQGRDTTLLEEILDKTAEQVSKHLTNQPEVEAELMTTIGLVYSELGQYLKAEDSLRKALALRRKMPGADLAVATSLRRLASHVGASSAGRCSEARVMLEEALAINRRRLGNEDIEVANCLYELAEVLNITGTLAETETTVRQALAMQRKILGREDKSVASSLIELAEVHAAKGEWAEAEDTAREAVAIRKKLLVDRHPDTAFSLYYLSETLLHRGKIAEAEAAARESDSMVVKLMGDEHLFVPWWFLKGTPDILRAEGKLTEATALVHERIDKQEQELSDRLSKQPERPDFLRDRGCLRGRTGRWTEAAADLSKAVLLRPDYHSTFYFLAAALAESGDLEAYRRLCLQIRERFGGTESIDLAASMAWSCLVVPSHNPRDAITDSRLADAGVRFYKGERRLLGYQSCKALAEYRRGQFASAMEWAVKTLSQPEYAWGWELVNDSKRVGASMVLAMSNYQLHQPDQARAALARGLEFANKKLPKLERDDLSVHWPDWVFAQVLMREARALIEGGGKASN